MQNIHGRQLNSILEILESYKHFTKEITVANKTVLLKEGETAKNIFFVKEGCLRMWMNHEGKEITCQFFFENEMVASIESFRHNMPSRLNIQAIEPAALFVLSKKNFDLVIKESPFIKDYLLELAFNRFSDYSKLYLSFLKNNPVERYKDLLANQPRIIQRVPQHFIASYLGITPVSLSRIRKKISK
jgi:CRP-like cAMP-binding protein